MIPQTVEVTLESPVSNNFRCKMACDALDIDIHKKSIHHLKVDNINLPENWNVGLIYGASGSGKTTLAKQIFGNDIFKTVLDADEPIINQFPSEMSYDECAALLTGIGLNSVPCWVRPVRTLSNGQRARAEAALLMCQNHDIVVIDEWTSVVDRTVAKAMSYCVQKFARKFNKRIILLSCHYDILEWIVPDWLIDCNEQMFHVKQHEDFFFTKRDELTFDIREIGRASWRYFSKYHYLSDKLPAGEIYLYGLYLGDKQIGFHCFANYTPKRRNERKIFHCNRLVIHPDYQGLGLGRKFITENCRIFAEKYPHFRVMTKFSALPVYRSLIKDKDWRFLGAKRMMGMMQKGAGMNRNTGFREAGIKTFHFEYIGKTV